MLQCLEIYLPKVLMLGSALVCLCVLHVSRCCVEGGGLCGDILLLLLLLLLLVLIALYLFLLCGVEPVCHHLATVYLMVVQGCCSSHILVLWCEHAVVAVLVQLAVV